MKKKQSEALSHKNILRTLDGKLRFDFTDVRREQRLWRLRRSESMFTGYRNRYDDDFLGGEWGLDASDFGMQAWGDS